MTFKRGDWVKLEPQREDGIFEAQNQGLVLRMHRDGLYAVVNWPSGNTWDEDVFELAHDEAPE